MCIYSPSVQLHCINSSRSVLESAMITMNHAGQQYNVSYYQQHHKSQTELTCSYDLDMDPMNLIYRNNLKILKTYPVYQKSTFQVKAFKSYSITDRQTDMIENITTLQWRDEIKCGYRWHNHSF